MLEYPERDGESVSSLEERLRRDLQEMEATTAEDTNSVGRKKEGPPTSDRVRSNGTRLSVPSTSKEIKRGKEKKRKSGARKSHLEASKSSTTKLHGQHNESFQASPAVQRSVIISGPVGARGKDHSKMSSKTSNNPAGDPSDNTWAMSSSRRNMDVEEPPRPTRSLPSSVQQLIQAQILPEQTERQRRARRILLWGFIVSAIMVIFMGAVLRLWE